MPDIKSLRSYLVSLGFSVNTSQLAQFNNALQTAAQVVDTNTTKIITNIMKWQGVVIGMFDAVGVSVVALMDKTAVADQQYRLLGQTMFMDTQNAKSMKIAMDALGLTLNQIAFDPESNARYAELQTFQNRLLAMEGFQNFEQTMIQVRNAQMEFAKFQISMLYFRDFLTRDIFIALGGEKLTIKLREWNEYIVAHLPEWSRIITTYIVPVLRDAWMIMKDLWQIGKDFAQLFTNIVGLFSGDPTIQGQVSFEKFAKALSKVANELALILHLLFQSQGILVGGAAGGAIGSLIGGGIGLVTGGPAGALAGAATGGLIGTGIGVAGGGAFDLIRQGWHGDEVRSLASEVGANLGVDPSTIYSQWAFETGNFTNRGARELNNLAGIRIPGSNDYRAFSSLSDFGDYYTSLIQRRYPGAAGAQSIDQYATALKAGGYFGDTLQNYERGMHSFEGAYGGGSTIQIGSINIMQPNASPEQIRQAIADGIKDHQNTITSANLAELRAMY